MGTNYYCIEECEICGMSIEKRHIGKSSAGWCFMLHIYPEKIESLEGWIEYLRKPNRRIEDEYGVELDLVSLLLIILHRGIHYKDAEISRIFSPDYLIANHAVRGPNNLLRFDLKHCAGHGLGTYDYVSDDFR